MFRLKKYDLDHAWVNNTVVKRLGRSGNSVWAYAGECFPGVQLGVGGMHIRIVLVSSWFYGIHASYNPLTSEGGSSGTSSNFSSEKT